MDTQRTAKTNTFSERAWTGLASVESARGSIYKTHPTLHCIFQLSTLAVVLFLTIRLPSSLLFTFVLLDVTKWNSIKERTNIYKENTAKNREKEGREGGRRIMYVPRT